MGSVYDCVRRDNRVDWITLIVGIVIGVLIGIGLVSTLALLYKGED